METKTAVEHRDGQPAKEWKDNWNNKFPYHAQAAYRDIFFRKWNFVTSYQQGMSACGIHFGSIRIVGEFPKRNMQLPVYSLTFGATEVRLSHNLDVWAVSVKADRRIIPNFHDLFERDEWVYNAEGFTRDWIFGPYSEDPTKFTVKFVHDAQLFAFLFLLTRGLWQTAATS